METSRRSRAGPIARRSRPDHEPRKGRSSPLPMPRLLPARVGAPPAQPAMTGIRIPPPRPATASSTSTAQHPFPTPLPQRELDCDFDQHVDRHAFALRRREAPLAHCGDSALVQTVSKAMEYVGLADSAVTTDDDLEENVASNPPPSRVFCVLRLHLVQQPRRLDAAAWPIRA